MNTPHDLEERNNSVVGKYKVCRLCGKVCLREDSYFNLNCPVAAQRLAMGIKRLESK